ncbi:D-alanyl-D-alanine carboxypeptidase family protein [Luteimicrobium sp. DT211]|uniref:D-alanyl-D-alanine carboxypeptidase family protein n=1 Tax=Luteimicrobium sp. DT211 TaxID=3393412 RepID=UPI003CEA6352
MPFVISPAPRRRRALALLVTCAVGGAGLGGVAAYRHAEAGPQPRAVATSPAETAAPAAATTEREPAPRDADEKPAGSGGVVTVFSDDPTVSHLDPALLAALRTAATDAADARGIRFVVNSGWRSAADQADLLDDAIAKYGSKAAAERWVATPGTSEHVKGEAVDLGPMKATDWLAQHGAAYGLCQVYANESWHYELRPSAARDGCPAMYADPTQDPRMQR